jgi:hypothetical protein
MTSCARAVAANVSAEIPIAAAPHTATNLFFSILFPPW